MKPCQDVSHAGKRAGLRPDTRTGLWTHMAYAISQLRPSYVVAENVRGLLSASADSDLEPCPWCVGGAADGEPDLRALGAVLGDLADLGYDARWVGLRAADVGAPHGRFRVFILATDAGRLRGQQRRLPTPGQTQRGGPLTVPGVRRRESAADAEGNGRHQWRTEPTWQLGGSDVAVGGCWYCGEPITSGTDCENCGASTADAQRISGAGRGGVRDGCVGGTHEPLRQPITTAASGRSEIDWGPYEPAVRRWARILGRSAPPPTEPGPKGGQRLAPRFVEFLMGLPAGWVTDVPGLSRNAQLKALGNGVVPQQALAASQLLTKDQWVA